MTLALTSPMDAAMKDSTSRGTKLPDQRHGRRSLQRHLQPHFAVLILGLVVDDQEYPRRIQLRVRQQALLHGCGTLLTQRP